MPINTPYNVLYDLMNNCNHRYNIYLSVPIGYYPFTNYNESKPMTNNKSTFYFSYNYLWKEVLWVALKSFIHKDLSAKC